MTRRQLTQRKLNLYIENSVISMYFQDDAPYLRDLTRQFWKEALPCYDVYVSEIVLNEISATPEARLRKAMESLIKGFDILEITEDVVNLADKYIFNRRIPRGDSIHLACASISEMNFIVTWNLRHIYKRGTQEMVREVNARLRYPVPSIETPEDFLGEGEV